MRLHEVQCARNNFKCPKCGDIVAKVDKEQHELDAHTEKPAKAMEMSAFDDITNSNLLGMPMG